jgi:hypothetical protein
MWSRGDSILCALPRKGGTILCWRLNSSEYALTMCEASHTYTCPEFFKICPQRVR